MNKPEGNKKNSNVTKVDNFRIIRVFMFETGDVTFDLEVNGISLYGLKVVEYKDGDFIGFPQRKGKNGKYYYICWAKFSEDDTKAIIEAVEKALHAK